MAGAYSVTQVNTYIKNMFGQDFVLNRIAVRGEVSNCKYHPSGHIYFTLKDGGGALSAVMFAGQRRNLHFRLEEGQSVVVRGNIDVYERDGKYQLYAREIELEGTGNLYERYLKLKAELEEMGMFAAEYKRPIPAYAMSVGIITAKSGAAIQDIINIATRRNPYVQLYLYPAVVQGEAAVPSIVKGLETLDQKNLDVIIVGRGGGSIEDLWAFNEEAVARAIFACHTPVISAVGHETDFTIADYVADLRAPTPSAAAELAVFDYQQYEERIAACQLELLRSMKKKTDQKREQTSRYHLQMELFQPGRQLDARRHRLALQEETLQRTMEQVILTRRHQMELLIGRLKGLSPLDKISRGYGYIAKADGRGVSSVQQVEVGEHLTIYVSDGILKTCVENKEKQ